MTLSRVATVCVARPKSHTVALRLESFLPFTWDLRPRLWHVVALRLSKRAKLTRRVTHQIRFFERLGIPIPAE